MLRPGILLVCLLFGVAGATLETINDNQLLNLIKTEKYVVAFFTKPDCEKCTAMENTLLRIREDLVDILSAWVVQLTNSQMLRLYSGDKEPAIVFYRQGIPILLNTYALSSPETNKLEDDHVLNTFIESKEPLVKDLTDDNFEHLTQVSTGATTGDWFVMFYSLDCVECQRLLALWETVGLKLKQRVNVACVNKQLTGPKTARRFSVSEVPHFILFRHNKMYRYLLPKHDVDSFVMFAKQWYVHAHGEKIPVPQSPFDDFTQMIATFLKTNPWIMKLGSITVGVLVIVTFASKLRTKAEAPKKDE